MTDAEWKKYKEIIEVINAMNLSKDKEQTKILGERRKLLSAQLADLIKQHGPTPRIVRMDTVTSPMREVKDGITWWDLKNTKQISEFVSDGSRCMGCGGSSETNQ